MSIFSLFVLGKGHISQHKCSTCPWPNTTHCFHSLLTVAFYLFILLYLYLVFINTHLHFYCHKMVSLCCCLFCQSITLHCCHFLITEIIAESSSRISVTTRYPNNYLHCNFNAHITSDTDSFAFVNQKCLTTCKKMKFVRVALYLDTVQNG